MPIIQPSRSEVHISTPLTNVSIAYMQDPMHFVAGQVFPEIPVSKQADAYYIFERGEMNRDEAQERAPGTESAGGSYEVGSDTYYAKVYGFHRDVPDQVRQNADNQFNLDREATIYVTNKALLRREVMWTSKFFTAGAPGDTWMFDVDGVASSPTASASFDPTDAANNDVLHWSDAASTPIEDVRRGKRYVMEETGFVPNHMTMSQVVYDALIDHPDVVGRIDRGQTTGAARANLVTLADLFEVDKVLVMRAIQNTGKKGQAAAHSFIAGKNALLSYAPATPGLLTPSAGYTFNWSGLYSGDGAGMGARIKKFRIEAIESDRVEIGFSFDQKKTGADLGYFFGGIVA
jgi:hypothetical protein